MTEYIYQIEDDESDVSEVFIGWIRKGHELIRCKDCKYFYKEERYCVLGTVAISDGYCYLGERKEE